MNSLLDASRDASLPVMFGCALWTLLSIAVLSVALGRQDFDPVTRLTWVLVIILVPFFGVPLYWLVAPKQPPVPSKDYTDQSTTCAPCGTTIPAGATRCPKCGWSYVQS